MTKPPQPLPAPKKRVAASHLKAAMAEFVASPVEPRAFVPLNPVLDEIATSRLAAEAAIADCEEQLWLIEPDLSALDDQEVRLLKVAKSQYEGKIDIAGQLRRESAKPLELRRDRLLIVKATQESARAALSPTSVSIQGTGE